MSTIAKTQTLRADSSTLKDHVYSLTSIVPSRSIFNPISLDSAAAYIESHLRKYSSRVMIQEYESPSGPVRNVIASFGLEDDPRIIVGTHYDVAGEQPGADDNASGVAGLLELARLLATNDKLKKRIDLAAYTLEEPPYFKSEYMGSFIHAKSLHDDSIKVDLMISLEMIGYFTDRPNSQDYPLKILKWFYPKRGNFIGVVSNFATFFRMNRFVRSMKKGCGIPVRSLAAPALVTGVDYSDHRNYWHFGYKAIMITDTAFMRNKHYHETTDTPEKLDYHKMAEVVNGVYRGILGL